MATGARSGRSGDDGATARLAEACRILALEGQEHFFLGHASIRAEDRSAAWVKPSGIGLAEMRPADAVLVSLDGVRLGGSTRPLHGELPIHLAIYRRRPDVGAIVHTHPQHVAAFAASDARFEMVSQDSLVALAGIARYEDAELVDTGARGDALAAALGTLSIAILRNHGLVVAGPSIEETVVTAVSVERSLACQLAATRFGAVRPIPDEAASRMAASFGPARTAAIYGWLARRLHEGA